MSRTERLRGLLEHRRELCQELDGHRFESPVAYIYNPLVYAREAYDTYLRKWALPDEVSPQRAVLLGMNPGPWGMAQTGVPFGAVPRVRDWLGVEGRIVENHDAPARHPKRPLLGFECTRVEVSGDRLWGWAQQRYGTPARFFQDFFVVNYCPLLFLEEGARNLTPDKLAAADRTFITEVCDRYLARMIELLGIEHVIGVGVYAQKRAQIALGEGRIRIDRVLHPSPASPIANRGWAELASNQLSELGLEIPSQPK